jgi:hypothetical protein
MDSFYTGVVPTVSLRVMGVSSEMMALPGSFSSTRICPMKLNTFLLTVSLNPFASEMAMIITITLMAVATVESRIIKREKDPAPPEELNAIRFAIKPATFNGGNLS